MHRFGEERAKWVKSGRTQNISDFISREIKWTSELEDHLRRGTKLTFSKKSVQNSLYRPFVKKITYFSDAITHRPYQNFNIFPDDNAKNCVISVGCEERIPFTAIAANALPNKDLFMPGAGQCFPRFRFNNEGDQIDNITDWALDQFRTQYAGHASITKDAIFHYVYAVLHDPLYREKYAQNLKREFPRIPFYPDFAQWAAWGETLMALHIGYESVAPWPLKRLDVPDAKARAAGLKPKPILKSDPDSGVITLDSETQLTGVPAQAWTYRLGNRSALDWILDQHKEKTPKDPTIREKFNTYRFADYKEKVVDLLMRVTRVSVETMEIVAAMRGAARAP
jgi:predicted helicase